MGRYSLGSDSKEPPKPRFRFNFSGQSKLAKNADTMADDVLGSLNRQASLERQASPAAGPGKDEMVEEVVAGGEGDVVPMLPVPRGKKAGHVRSVFALFLGGFFAVWLYGTITGTYQIPYVNGVIRNPDVQVGIHFVSTNSILFGGISVGLLITLIYARHRRKN